MQRTQCLRQHAKKMDTNMDSGSSDGVTNVN